MIDIFRDEQPIRKRLQRIYAVALDIYLSGDAGPRGCFTVMTAASEAVADPDIRAMVLEGFSELDKAFAACFRLAKEKGELPQSADPVVLAQLASATIHTIAIRARARVPRKELEAIVNGAIDVMSAANDRTKSIPSAIDHILQPPPASNRSICCATYFEISSASVSAALCGVSTTFGWVQNGLPAAAARFVDTSSDAAPSVPSSRHAKISASFCNPPRPALISTGAPIGLSRLSFVKNRG